MLSLFAGAQKLGQPVPESNLLSERNSSAPHAAQRFLELVRSGFYDDTFALASLQLHGQLGVGQIVQRTTDADSEDITIIIGKDLVDKQGLKITVAGLVIGIGGSLALTRIIGRFLYGIQPTDPLTFGLVSLLLAVVALAACAVPARRAAKVDPMVALRYE